MQTLINQLRARLAPYRALVVALLFGPVIGAMLAFGTGAAQDATKKDANEITIDNFTFTPKELTVPVGTTVKWLNHDDIPHTIVGKKPTFRPNALAPHDAYWF